jgi:hypothetical protein
MPLGTGSLENHNHSLHIPITEQLNEAVVMELDGENKKCMKNILWPNSFESDYMED